MGQRGLRKLNNTHSSMVSLSSVVLDPFTHTTVAQPCDAEDNFLPEGTPPAQAEDRVPGNWAPFNS